MWSKPIGLTQYRNWLAALLTALIGLSLSAYAARSEAKGMGSVIDAKSFALFENMAPGIITACGNMGGSSEEFQIGEQEFVELFTPIRPSANFPDHSFSISQSI